LILAASGEKLCAGDDQMTRRPKIAAFAHEKGGVGKSTTCVNVGVAAAQRCRVALVDADPQESLATWRAGRRVDWPHVVAMRARDLPNWLSTNGAAFDLVLVDTPGHNTDTLAEVAALADLTVIVSQPTVLANAVAAHIRRAFVNAGVEFAVLLSHTPPSLNARLSAWLAEYANLGEIAAGFLGYRMDYQDAMRHGLGVTEYRPSGAAAFEVHRVTAWLLERLERIP
jgi:chromosome partitioning protein